MTTRPPPPPPPPPPPTPRASRPASRPATGAGAARFRAPRPRESVALDNSRVGSGAQAATAPPYIAWPEFYSWFRAHWRVGAPDWPNPNVALVGMAGSGKTTLARQILQFRERVVVFGTKPRDPSLYGPFERLGYVIVNRWSPQDLKQPRVIFRPPLDAPTAEALQVQREAFLRALLGLFRDGGWTVYFDEVRYLSETLRLRTELDQLWLQGRSNGVVIVAGTQRPVSVPINMFEQSPHLFTWRITGLDDRRTMASYTGALAPTVVGTAAVLPRHETLYVDSIEDVAVRTRVSRET